MPPDLAAEWLATHDPEYAPDLAHDWRAERVAAEIFESRRRDVHVEGEIAAIFAEAQRVPHAPKRVGVAYAGLRSASGSIDAQTLPPGVEDVMAPPGRATPADSGELAPRATGDEAVDLSTWLRLSARRMAASHPQTAAHYREESSRRMALADVRDRLRIEITTVLCTPRRYRPQPECVTWTLAPSNVGTALRSVVGPNWERVTLGHGGGLDGVRSMRAVVDDVVRRLDFALHDDLEVAIALDAGATSAAKVEEIVPIPKARIPGALARLENAKIITNEGTSKMPVFTAA